MQRSRGQNRVLSARSRGGCTLQLRWQAQLFSLDKTFTITPQVSDSRAGVRFGVTTFQDEKSSLSVQARCKIQFPPAFSYAIVNGLAQ